MILLKNEVKDLFEKAGIPELTVSRGIEGYLTIVGKECGQLIMTISQVTVPRTMNKATRKIIIDDYLVPALTKYSKDFVNMVKAKKKAKQAKKALSDELKNIEALGYDHSYYSAIKFRGLNGSAIKFGYFLNTENYIIEDRVSKKELKEIMTKIEKAETELKMYLKLLKEFTAASDDAEEEFKKVKITCGW
jgi:hypothetical protein